MPSSLGAGLVAGQWMALTRTDQPGGVTKHYSWVIVMNRAQSAGDVELCSFYEEYDKRGTDAPIAHGIFSLDDLKSEYLAVCPVGNEDGMHGNALSCTWMGLASRTEVVTCWSTMTHCVLDARGSAYVSSHCAAGMY
jgi:hypothetical protein